MKRIRQGNTINFRYSVYRTSGSLEEKEDLTGIELTTVLRNRLYGTAVDVPFSVEGNVIMAQIPGIPYMKTGTYNFCLSYRKDGEDFTVDTDAFQIVDSSAKTGGENACPHVEVETVELKGVVEFGIVSGGVDQVQADWEESNTQSKAFIKNKPVLSKVATSGKYSDLAGTPDIPTISNDFTNADKEKLKNLGEYVKNVSLVPTDSLVRVDISTYDPVSGTLSSKSEFLNLATSELAGLMSALDKKKLSTLANYDDTGLRTALQGEINRAKGVESTLDGAIQKVASDLSNFITGTPDADDIINRWQEVTAFLNGITEDKTLSGMLLDLKAQINESVTAKLADYYTAARVDELFVKKLVGSRLITEEEATKLAGLQNYDDTAVRELIEAKADPVKVRSVGDPNGSASVYAIDPNVFYDFDRCGILHLSLNPPTDRTVLSEYMFQFVAADSGFTLTIDGNIQWLNGVPAIEDGRIYQVSIVNGIAVIGGVDYVNV